MVRLLSVMVMRGRLEVQQEEDKGEYEGKSRSGGAGRAVVLGRGSRRGAFGVGGVEGGVSGVVCCGI
jgi:hypothetical protein